MNKENNSYAKSNKELWSEILLFNKTLKREMKQLSEDEIRFNEIMSMGYHTEELESLSDKAEKTRERINAISSKQKRNLTIVLNRMLLKSPFDFTQN